MQILLPDGWNLNHDGAGADLSSPQENPVTQIVMGPIGTLPYDYHFDVPILPLYYLLRLVYLYAQKLRPCQFSCTIHPTDVMNYHICMMN